jgi:glycosidase
MDTTSPTTTTSAAVRQLDDFKIMLHEAHRRDLKVITELVINHTSDQHPWFQAARRAPPGSPERDFYVWSDTDQKYKGTRVIFTDTEASNWTYDPIAKAYFWHRFFSHQPDLNFDNPKVLEALFGTMRFWLDMGVDGRLDAIRTWWNARARTARTCPGRTRSSSSFARRSTRATATASCSPRPTSGRRTCANFSAKATSATPPTTSR